MYFIVIYCALVQNVYNCNYYHFDCVSVFISVHSHTNFKVHIIMVIICVLTASQLSDLVLSSCCQYYDIHIPSAVDKRPYPLVVMIFMI